MKQGEEYDNLVFMVLREYYIDFHLVKNDKILGNENNIRREIDVSIEGSSKGYKV
jgi:hypothetical protein